MSANFAIGCATLLVALLLVSRLVLDLAARRAQLHRELAMHERAATGPVEHLAAAVDALTAAAAKLEHTAATPGPSRVGRSVTVHTKQPDDLTIFGVVVGDYTDRLCLDDATLVVPDGANPALPGRQDIPVRDIAWVDVHQVAVVPVSGPEPVRESPMTGTP